MLDKLRDPTKNKSSVKRFFYLILFAAIILTFVFMTGTGAPVGGAAGGIAAVVNGEVISFRDFSTTFSRQESQMQQSMKNIPAAMRSMYESQFGTREQRAQRVLEQMIQNKLATQLAGDSGVFVSDKEVLTEISKMDVFQENGQFKASRYHQLLQANQLSPAKFEDNIRGDIAFSRFQRLFLNSVKATNADVELDKYANSQKVSVDFIEVSQDALKKGMKVDAGQLGDFKSKQMDKIKTYYNDNKSQYTLPEKVAVSHILIKTKSQSDEDYKAALDKITDIRKQITDSNFADLAEKYSEDTGSKVKGGSLGEVDKNVSFVEPFKKAVFSLKVGELSQPVKTRFGYHVIKVTGKKDGRVKPLAEVTDEIAKKFIIDENVKKDMDALMKGEDSSLTKLKKLQADYGLKWKNTGEFSLSQNQVPQLGDASKIWETVSKALTTQATEMVESGGKYYLIKVKDSKFEAAKKDEKLEDKIDQLSAERTNLAVQAWVDSQKDSASIKRNLKVFNF